jgi:hypothetical protein
MKAILFSLIILCKLTYSQDDRWVYWDYSSVGEININYYYDTETFEKNGNIITVWVKMSYSGIYYDNTYKKYITEEKAQWNINCLTRSSSEYNYYVYFTDGSNEFVKGSQYVYDKIAPETVAESLFKKLCK